MSDRKSASREYYDKLAPIYDQHSHSKHLEALYADLIKTADGWGLSSVLDVGCGTGSLLELLRRRGVGVAGADISPKMIERAKKRLGEDVDLRVADSESLPWGDASFSLAVCVGSLHHYPNPLRALSEMRRVLRCDGHVMIADPTLPPFVRQLANTFIRFSREGATRLYSEMEIHRLLKEVGFEEMARLDIDSSAIVMIASANK